MQDEDYLFMLFLKWAVVMIIVSAAVIIPIAIYQELFQEKQPLTIECTAYSATYDSDKTLTCVIN